MSNDWLQQNSGGSGNPGCFFPNKGAKIVGKLAELPKQVDTQYGERLVCELVALDGTTGMLKGAKGADGEIVAGDEVTLWIKPGAMASAVRDALGKADVTGLQEGGTLAVAFSDTRDTGKAEPVKLYAAQYQPAVPAVAISDSLI